MLGIHILDNLYICKRLFADDMGIMIPAQPECFKKVKDCISLYEQASGAKLNIQKSMVVPLGM